MMFRTFSGPVTKHCRLFAIGVMTAVVSVLAGQPSAAEQVAAATPMLALGSTADHSQFEALNKDFKTGPEVTAACLSCHNQAAKQLHKTTHWTWAFENELTDQTLGKKNVVNNFCVATATNWPRCTSCHIGYGWKNDKFDFSSEKSVDCLVCHDTTGTYKKYPAGAGHPAYKDKTFPPNDPKGKMFKAVNLGKVARNVGTPSRKNCGACHFYGGGGNGVKHGDLDSTLGMPDKALDVHMDKDGLNFNCQDCHTTGSHEVSGSRYVTKAVDTSGIDVPGRGDKSRATCESCHGMTPHPESANVKLNEHTDKVACPTCHVPEFARGGRKTKTYWDWSKAGQKGEGGQKIVKDKDGYDIHHIKKGLFEWQANVVPTYRWFDGEIRYSLLQDKIDPSGVVPINSIGGSYDEPGSRIWPFKVMRGQQPYDKKNLVLGVPHLFGKDENAFWGGGKFDWNKALAAGLAARGIEYSGEYGFVDSEYYWPITHMVAPKDKALECDQCHARDGRLAGLDGFYMPGRDTYPLLDTIGWLLAALSLAGVLGHGALRIVTQGKRD